MEFKPITATVGKAGRLAATLFFLPCYCGTLALSLSTAHSERHHHYCRRSITYFAREGYGDGAHSFHTAHAANRCGM